MTPQPTPIWSGAWHLFKSNFTLLVALALIDVSSEFLTGWSDSFSLVIVESVFILVTATTAAFAFHLSEISGTRFGLADLLNGVALPNRAFVLITLCVVATIVVAISLMSQIYSFFDVPIDDQTTALDTLFLGFFAFSVLVYLAFLCRFGTVFPAAAIDNDWSLRRAYARGRKTTWMICKGLLLGPVLGLILLGLLGHLFDRFGDGLHVWTAAGDISLLGTVTTFVFYVGNYFVTAQGVVVFCNAYRHANDVSGNAAQG